MLTGLDIEAKAALVQRQLAGALPPDVQWELARTDHADAGTEEQASATLRCVARGADAKAIGRAFSGAAVELALASYPGFHLTAPPGDAQPYGVFTAGYVDRTEVHQAAVLPDGRPVPVPEPAHDPAAGACAGARVLAWTQAGPVRRAPLGLLAGARSGDKGGDANVGVWARDDAAWRWLAATLTEQKLRELLPEAAGLPGDPVPAAEPARRQLRHRGPARPGRRRGSPVRPAGQGGRRVATVPLPRCARIPAPGGLPVTALRSAVDDKSAEYAANRAAMVAKLAEIDGEQAKAIAGGGPKYTERHRGRGKMTGPRADRAAAGS